MDTMQFHNVKHLSNITIGHQYTFLAANAIVLIILVLVLLKVVLSAKPKRQLTPEKTETRPKTAEPSSEKYSDTPVTAPKPKPIIHPRESLQESASELGQTDIRSGLNKTRNGIISKLSKLFATPRKIEAEFLEELHEALFRSDIGVETTDYLISKVKETLVKSETITLKNLIEGVSAEIETILTRANYNSSTDSQNETHITMIVGVNGVGKTTTIGKLAAQHQLQGKTVTLCAADTYRAAAAEQLQAWADRTNSDIIRQESGSDPAAVAYDATQSALAKKADVLLIDTAGRLHNKADLMAELQKIKKVIRKSIARAPHETWLVIDATTGQNAEQQVKVFNDVVELTGLIVTKLDGTAKGGVIVGIAHKYNLPIRYIGIGEKISDLQLFDPKKFTAALLCEPE